MLEMKDRLMNVEQVREILQCSRRHVYNLISSGALPALRIGDRKGVRIRKSSLDSFLNRNIYEEQ